MASQQAKPVGKSGKPDTGIPSPRSPQRKPITNFQRYSNRSPSPPPRPRSRPALFNQSIMKPATATDTRDSYNGKGRLLGYNLDDKVGACSLFDTSPPEICLDLSLHDYKDGSQGLEAENFRYYWAKRDNAKNARAIKSKVRADKFMMAPIDLDGADEDDVWGHNLDVDKETRRRLEEARLNTFKNVQRETN